jgi:membrane associated rhomboid family serine protease
MEDSYRKKMRLGQDGNALVQLVVINAVMFALVQFVFVLYKMSPNTSAGDFYSGIFNYLALPAGLDRLASRPWTFLTYMFTDRLVLRFISNLFWLWIFGYILQDLMGNRKLIPIYIYGGVAGGLMYVLAFAFIPGLKPLIPTASLFGASPAVVAVALATTTVAPEYRIFPMINGGIPLWILSMLFLVLSFSTIGRGDSGVYVSHLAGGGAGFLFIYLMRRGYDGSIWINNLFDWTNDLFNPNKRKLARSPKDEFYYKVSGTQPFKKIPNVTQQRIDEILDKINQQGYRFLTDEEKDILKRAADEEDL